MSHKLLRAGAVAGLVGLAAGAARGQECLWTQRSVSGPSARYDHAMAYDAARARVVLFGGREQFPLNGVFADTWEWDGSAWMQRQVTRPSARWGHAMAYDMDTQRIVLFGGSGSAGLLGDTWEWDGSAWVQRQVTGPSARAGHGMAFDGVRRGVLLHGSDAGAGDTWLWLAGAWTVQGNNGPSSEGLAMASDSVRNRIVLFTYWTSSGQTTTREWNGFSWSSFVLSPASGGSTMAFDQVQGKMLLFGGNRQAVGILGESLEWSGAGWSLRTLSGPARRVQHAMAVDAARGKVVLFGGIAGSPAFADTWEWAGDASGGAVLIPGQPGTVQVPPGASATLSVVASGSGLTYRWRREGVPLFNGGSVSGADTPMLVINPVACEDAATYDVLVSDACGTAQSNLGHLAVECFVPCYANCDFSQIPPILNVNDFSCFLGRYGAGGTAANCDGSTTPPILTANDFVCFLNKYAAGCS